MLVPLTYCGLAVSSVMCDVADLMVEFMISHMAKNFRLDLYRFVLTCNSPSLLSPLPSLQEVSGWGSPYAVLSETLQDQTQLWLEGALGW